MPEVIDLLSSTPPPPLERREQLSIRRAHSHPPVVPASDSIFSDEIDLSAFTYDNPIEQPAKRRRLSHEITPVKDVPLPPAKNSLFLFSDDDIILSSDGPAPTKPPAWNGESDPIVFTSSAPEPTHNLPVRPAISSRAVNTISLDDDDAGNSNNTRSNNRSRREAIQVSSDQLDFPDVDDLLDVAQRVEANAFSSRTANVLATLEDRSHGSNGESASRSSRGRRTQDQIDDIEVEEMPPPRKPQRKATKVTSEEKEAKAREREAAKAQRERDKQLEKERKQKAKEDKAREKQLAADIAEVNKLKVDKKDSTHEMLIDLASTFTDTSLGNQTSELMRLLKVDLSFFPSTIPNIVKWRRKVRATYNDSLGHWEPCALHIRDEEEHVLCLIAAQDFINMIVAPTTETRNTINDHVERLKLAYPKSRPIYLIEGLTSLMRKNNNAQNRAYQAAVRRQYEDSSARPSTRRKQQQPEPVTPIDSDTVEDALLDLQVTHSCLIHHTSSPAESAEWIKNFTEYISTVPYRRERMDLNDSAFCMDVGQVKPGENRSDAFVKMLQEVNRVTASMAYGIATQYPSAMDLVNAMRKHGPGLLEDVKKSANKNGALTDSRIGPAVSRRLYKVFMGMDPTSTDI
ncbi:ERCC4 domain-domain-containing protein [Aspergillus welwitschiae]|uniref:ERCC4 domain-domain-containing protein n=1 Tax=Aspergillus welwitschiae TaxID=1341132 RepID=A0A3F3QF41_9EURO|nr:ERCC4 domain-domain-containing protein [Aspergillus welwitschiae]RDH37873.1 ERCC4 domain-domain-containing protein [Aspergillus welwitschiae]